jgi:hypothetical protein
MSTDSIDDTQRKALTDFYRAEIEPLASQRLLDARVPPKADPNVTTYYKKRVWRRLEARDFELSLGDAQRVGATLDAFWAGTPLAGLGTKIAALSEKFPEVQQRADVSAFIYEML